MAVDKNEAHPYIMAVLLTGVFAGFGTIVWFGLKTFMLIDEMLNIFLLCGIAALGVHYLFFRSWKRYFVEILGYSFLGWGNICLGLFLAANYLFHAKPITETYALPKPVKINSTAKIEIKIEAKHFSDYRHMLRFDEHEINPKRTKKGLIVNTAEFVTANGYFGYKVLLEKRLY